MNNIETRLKNIMAHVLNVSVNEIKDDSSAYTIANWDSLKHLDLVLALQKEFGIKFGDEEIPTLINYQMILNTLKAYLE